MHLEFGSGLRACCTSSGIRSNSGLALRSAGAVCHCEWLGRSVDLDKRRGSAPRAGAAAWTGSTSGPGNVLDSRLQSRYAPDSTLLLHCQPRLQLAGGLLGEHPFLDGNTTITQDFESGPVDLGVWIAQGVAVVVSAALATVWRERREADLRRRSNGSATRRSRPPNPVDQK